MRVKKRTEEWYEEINKQFEEDSKTQDFSNLEMDKWFAEMLDERMGREENESVEEWYERMNKMYEEDAKTHDFSNPKMDEWFYSMIAGKTKTNKRRRAVKVAGIAAGIVLALSVGTNIFTEVTYGESLFQIIRNSIEAGQFTITGFSKNDDSEFENYDKGTMRYEANSIEEIFEQIKTDDTIAVNELFYVTDVPEQYQKWTANYNTKFQMLTINSQQKDSHIYIYEELNYQNIVSGTILESDIISTVFNENLQMDINIVKQMQEIRCVGYYIDVFYNNKRLKIEGNATLKEFEAMAKNISMRG